MTLPGAASGVMGSGGSDGQRIVLVLGSHRAGTSVTTRLLQLCGLYLGVAEQLLGPVESDNPRGFFEHWPIMRLNDELLTMIGGTWRDPPALIGSWESDSILDQLRQRARHLVERDFDGRSLWGFKDPRASLTLPFWRTVITPVAYVIPYRGPLDVARSLERRNGIGLEHGVALWTHYTASAIANTAGDSRLFARYDDLFVPGRKLVSELAAFLGLPDPADDPRRWALVQQTVDHALRHHAAAPAEVATHPAISPEARELLEALEHGASADGALDSLAASIVELGPPREPASRPRGVSSAAPAGSSLAPSAPRPRFGPRPLRVVAMLQVYNERRFLAGCIEHLSEQGIAVYVVDNESTDETLDIAQRYLGRGVIAIETLAREDCFALRVQCKRQEELATTLDADWLIHHDADEIRVSPKRGQKLAAAIGEFDQAGFNAVNFLEFAFVPTREFPDHDHPDFARTMRWYYPFLPTFPHRCNAWRRQDETVDLVTGAGHSVSFPGLRMAPVSLYMRHYLCVSREHAIEKFVRRRFAEDEVRDGWFGWRSQLREEMIELPSVTSLRHFVADHLLDPSEPLKRHPLADRVPPPVGSPAA